MPVLSGGCQASPLAQQTTCPPSRLCVEPLKEAVWMVKVGGLQVAAETQGKKTTQTDTMDTNPKILMPMVVAHWKQRGGMCVFEVFWQITHTPLLLVKKVVVKGYPILASPLSPPPPLLLCMHISHSHGINHNVGPGQHMHTDTHKCRRMPFCHTSGAWMPGGEREGDVFIHFLLCTDRVLVQWIGKGALDNEASVITELLQPLTTSIHWDQIKAFNCFASY